jgi:hypothetical protein
MLNVTAGGTDVAAAERFTGQYLYSYSYVTTSVKAVSHIACRAHAISLPCRALIHTCHAVPLPCSDSVGSFVKVRVVAENIRTASPTVQQIVFFL